MYSHGSIVWVASHLYKWKVQVDLLVKETQEKEAWWQVVWSHVMPCIRSIRNNSIAWFKVCQLGPWIYRHVERKIAETIFKNKGLGEIYSETCTPRNLPRKKQNEIIRFSKRCCRDRKRDRRASIPRTHELVALYWSLVWWGVGQTPFKDPWASEPVTETAHCIRL